MLHPALLCKLSFYYTIILLYIYYIYTVHSLLLHLNQCDDFLLEEWIRVPPLRDFNHRASLVQMQMARCWLLVFFFFSIMAAKKASRCSCLPPEAILPQSNADAQTACERWFPDVSHRWPVPFQINGSCVSSHWHQCYFGYTLHNLFGSMHICHIDASLSLSECHCSFLVGSGWET